MERIRFTISVDPEVHAAFVEMAEVAGQSLSKCVGDWLADTTEASRFVTKKMREVRLSPAAAMRELHAFQREGTEATARLLAKVEADLQSIDGPGAAEPQRARRSTPPSSNTGGKGQPRTGPKL